jgi:hypothetical protein
VHDVEALLHWLAIASPVFDASGAWTGRTAASTLTLRVVDHAKALVTATLPRPGTAEEAAAIAELTAALSDMERGSRSVKTSHARRRS